VYLIAQDFLAKQFPEYWYFGIGTMLVLVLMFAAVVSSASSMGRS